ncbi:hypothetical protein DSECCO2_587090 [anaerobic digester metagenome]|jgi:hypothetical protein
MQIPNHLMTPQVRSLISENIALKPNNEILFQEMVDKELLKISEGAAVTIDKKVMR